MTCDGDNKKEKKKDTICGKQINKMKPKKLPL